MTEKYVESRGRDHYELIGGVGKEIFFRPYRYVAKEVTPYPIYVEYLDYEGRRCSGNVINFSYNGLAFIGNPNEVLRNGETLQSFNIKVADEVIFSGLASVRNQRIVEDNLIVGCALIDETLKYDWISRIKQISEAKNFITKFDEFLHLVDAPLPKEFKALICDMRLLLERYKELLDNYEKTFEGNLEQKAEWERYILSLIEPAFSKRFHQLIAELFEVTKNNTYEEHKIHYRNYSQYNLHELFEEGPIFHRSFHKPLGYAGDYGIMIMMYFPENHYQGKTLFGKLMHRMGCSLTSAKAAIARISYLTEQIDRLQKLYCGRDPFRVLSLACGPAKEVEDLIRENRVKKPIEITLIDQDKSALSYCHSRLIPLIKEKEHIKLNLLNTSVKTLIKDEEFVKNFPKQDMITSTGLFDYLNSKVAKRLLYNLVTMLKPGGTIFVGNLDVRCDTKFIFDNLLDWEMIYRSPQDLIDLTKEIDLPISVDVGAEKTGINLFLIIQLKEK